MIQVYLRNFHASATDSDCLQDCCRPSQGQFDIDGTFESNRLGMLCADSLRKWGAAQVKIQRFVRDLGAVQWLFRFVCAIPVPFCSSVGFAACLDFTAALKGLQFC